MVRFLALVGCFLLSGIAALIYETAWTQEFALVFGATELAVVTVLAAYMAGLTLGSAAGGRWSRRVERPILAYAVLEAGIALAALAVPAAVGLARRLNVALFGGAELPPAAGAPASVAFHLFSSFAILLIPTALMGATLPLLMRHVVAAERQLGPRAGVLYAANTIGAAMGTLLTAFVLLPRVGLDGAVWAAVALNGLVFVLAALLSAVSGPAPKPAPAEASPAAAGSSVILPLIAVSGMVSFTLEVAWTRLLSHVLGGSIYAFATMLAAFLTGIALGSAAASRLATDRERARRAFAVVQLLVAVLSVAAFLLVDRFAESWAALVGGGQLMGGAWLCAATLLPSTLGIGATFPLAVRILAARAEDAGPATARVYAWNTVGAVAGAMGAGLLALPWLRFEGTFGAAAALNLALAVAAAVLLRPRLRLIAGLGLAGLVLLAVAHPPVPWRVLRSSPLAQTVVATPEGPEPVQVDEAETRGPIVYYSVGRTATVLLRRQGVEWRLTTNGLPEAVIQPPGSRPSRYLVAHWMSLLPLALRPDTRSLLVVGLGGAGTVEDVPAAVERIHVVELEPEVVSANRFLAASRRTDPLRDPRVRLHLDDARSALQLAAGRFDAIVSQPSHPWTSGSSHLFTREFYELVRERLTARGVFVQWMGFSFVDEALLRTLIATLRGVFPHVELYQPPATGAALLVASVEPLDVAATAPQGVALAREAWAALGILVPEDVLAARVLDDAGSAAVALGSPVNTDRRNLLQTRSPQILSDPLTIAAADRAFAAVDPIRHLPQGVDALYMVRRLAAQYSIQRALRLATTLPRAEDRNAAFGLIDLASGHGDRGAQTLLGLMRTRRTGPGALLEDLEVPTAETEAPFALLLSARQAAIGPGSPPLLSAWAAQDVLARALIDGWQAVTADKPADVRALEAQLATVGPRHPAFAAATRLRIAWRAASGDPALAREGLRLHDALTANSAAMQDVLLRARLAAAAGDPDVVVVTLYEVLPALERRAELKAAAQEALRILDSAPGGEAAARARLRTALAAAAGSPAPAAQATRSRPASLAE